MLSYANGAGQGQHDAYVDALAQGKDQQEFVERQRQFDANLAQQKARDDAAAATTAQKNAETSRLRTFESGLQLPKNWANLSDAQKTAYLQARENRAMQEGDTDVTAATQKQLGDLALIAQRTANANFLSGPRTDLTNANVGVATARVPLIQAQTMAVRDLPARVREVAKGRDEAAIQRAAMEIEGRKELAQFSGAVRLQVARLAGAYHLTGIDASNAVRMAIAEVNDKTRVYLGSNNPQRQVLGLPMTGTDPTRDLPPPLPATPYPNINIELPAWPTAAGQPSGQSRAPSGNPQRSFPPTGFAPTASNATPGGTSTPEPLGLSPAGKQEFRAAKNGLTHGAPLGAIMQKLRAGAAAEGLKPHEVDAIERALQGTQGTQGTQGNSGTAPTTPFGKRKPPTTPFPHYGGGPVSSAIFGVPTSDQAGAGGSPLQIPF